jgi:PHD/YefM family antitoxin component YafN of YafNO toxin-antitoxin module
MSASSGGLPNVPLDEMAARDALALDRLGSLASVVRDVVAAGRPRMITDGGKPVAAIVDAHTYEQLQAAAWRQLRDDLHAAAAEADSGQVFSHEEVMHEVREELAGEPSGELLEQVGPV